MIIQGFTLKTAKIIIAENDSSQLYLNVVQLYSAYHIGKKYLEMNIIEFIESLPEKTSSQHHFKEKREAEGVIVKKGISPFPSAALFYDFNFSNIRIALSFLGFNSKDFL